MGPLRAALVLLAIAALAALLRSVGIEGVFPGGEEVVLASDDAQYHARRAWFSFLHFPAVLRFDAYLNHPQGAAVPWPPLYDLALAFAARVAGDDRHAFETTLAWAPVALGSATAVVVVLAARQLARPAQAIGAGVLYAWLPASIVYSRVGNPDHHAAVSLLGACLLALGLASYAQRASTTRIWGLQAGLVLARVAMLLTWHGSFLYVVLAEAAAIVAGVLAGRREQLIAFGVGQGVAAVVIAPFVAQSLSEVAGALSPIELSALHPLALVVAAWVSLASAELERRRPDAHPARKLARPVALAAAPILVALAFPATRAALEWAWAYAGRDEQWIAANFEAQPLFAGGVGRAVATFGYAAFALPLLPFAPFALRRPGGGVPDGAWLLATWTAGLGLVALSNTRYGNDAAPGVAISLAIGLGAVGERVHARWPRVGSGGVAAALGIALLAPPAWALLTRASHALAPVRADAVDAPRVVPNLTQSVDHFMRAVRAATPDTAGFDDLSTRPEYGVITPPTLGFAMKYTARRPTPADNFGPYLGPPGLALTRRFYSARREDAAVEIARRLRARYVATTLDGRPEPEMMIYRLHAFDGAGRRGQAPLTRFRLVVDDPPLGVPLGALSGVTRGVVRSPYKLFEIVDGAVLDVEAPAGQRVDVEIEVETSSGRRFVWRSGREANAAGRALLRVPYASPSDQPTHPTGPYTVRIGERVVHVSVDEASIQRGTTVAVP